MISNARPGRGGRRYNPYAFTEHGVLLTSHEELARKLAALEDNYDAQFKVVLDAIRELMAPPVPRRRAIGFRLRLDRGSTDSRAKPLRSPRQPTS